MMDWPLVRLGDLCDVTIGATPARNQPAYWGGNHVWLTISELNGGTVTESREGITDLGVVNSSSKLVPAGTLLFSFKLSIGKMAFAGVDLYTNEAIAALPIRNCRLLDRRFLYYGLSSIDTLGNVDVAAKGKVLNKAKLQRLAVPLPPLSEQRRIVEILDQADRLRRLRAEADAEADGILPALLTRAMGSSSSWTSNPRSRALADLVDPVSGATPSKSKADYWNGGVPWVSPKDMKRDFLSDAQDHVSPGALAETHLKVVDPGNVLIVVRGMILARNVPVALNLIPVTINQDMKALVPKTREVTGSYLWAALTLARTSLQTLVRTAAHGTRKLDTPELMQFKIVKPSLEQLALVDSAVRRHRLYGEQRATAAAQVVHLFKLLLRRAFDGSLTSAWREVHMNELLQEMEQQTKALAPPASAD